VITGTVLYVTTVVRHFPPLMPHACGRVAEWTTLIR
jgi:hypothetical protein